MPDHDGEGFLARWSRLKRTEVESPAHPATRPSVPVLPESSESAVAPLPLAAEPAVADGVSEAESPVPTDLPKLEDLTADTPLDAFLRKGVPNELKRLALRRAWTLDPAIRDFVEVAENQYDWNTPGGAPGFGDLDPGVDMKRLLAQATGQPLEPEPSSPEDTPKQRQNAAPDEQRHAAVRDGDPAEATSEVLGQPAASAETPPPPENAVQPDGQATPPEPGHDAEGTTRTPLRRRHGGALPI